MKNPNSFCVFYIPCANKDEARLLAQRAVKEKIAACANIIDKIESYYEWEGEVKSDSEFLLLLKSKVSMQKKVEELVDRHHSYDLPAVLSLSLLDGNDSYLTWIHERIQEN